MSSTNRNVDATAAAASTSAQPSVPRYRPGKRRKSQPNHQQQQQQHTHSCTSLYSLTDATESRMLEAASASSIPPALPPSALASSHRHRLDGRSVPNVNFYIPQEIEVVVGGGGATAAAEGSTLDRARCHLNLSLKNVCSPAEPATAAAVSALQAATTSGQQTATATATATSRCRLENLHNDDDDDENEDRSSGGLIGALRSWADKFRRWRSCVSSNHVDGTAATAATAAPATAAAADRKQSLTASMAAAVGIGRMREASVASVFGAGGTGDKSTSSRILRAFSHVGERHEHAASTRINIKTEG